MMQATENRQCDRSCKNFMRARRMKHCQLDNLLNDEGVSHGLPHLPKVRWLNRGTVLKCVIELRWEIVNFTKIKGKPVPQLQSLDWVHGLAFAVDLLGLNNQNRM